jgi:hypothetical protein
MDFDQNKPNKRAKREREDKKGNHCGGAGMESISTTKYDPQNIYAGE